MSLIALKCAMDKRKKGGWTNPYVTDGLIGHFDGIWNAGPDLHDLRATTWFNLAPNGAESVTVGDISSGWGEDSLTVTGAQTNCAEIPISLSAGCTVEAVTSSMVLGNTIKFWALCGANNSQIYDGYTQQWGTFNLGLDVPRLLTTANIASASDRIYWAASLSSSGCQVWAFPEKGGKVTDTTAVDFSSVVKARVNWSNSATSNARVMHSCRIYNRVLSDDEIAANYAVDKERFNLP